MEHYNRQQNWTNWTGGGGSPGNITAERVAQIVGWVTFAVGLPAICLAIYMLSQLVKGGNGTPVQAINLLIADVFNLFTRPQTISGSTTAELGTDIPSLIFYFGVASNIVFMVGVAQERHLLVASQRCHGCCRKAKYSSLISLATWLAPIGIVLLLYFGFVLAFSVCLLVPFPLLVFFLLDSCRASLCCPTSVRPSQRRRVLAMLVTILLNYSLLFLPFALATLLSSLEVQINGHEYFGLVANMMLYLSPVINPFLTLLLTKSLRELLDTFPCCRRKQTQTADASVVLENPNVALPLSDTENAISVVSGKGSGFPPQGAAMESPNGISTVFENFSATLGMSGTAAQIPTVSGGLSALPNMGMTSSQAPTPFGNLSTIPGLPNMGMTSSQAPSPFGNLSTIPGLPNMGMTSSQAPSPFGNLSTIPGLPNMGMTSSQAPTPFGNLSTIPGLPNMGMTSSQAPTPFGNLSTIPGLPNMGMTSSQAPTPFGNLSTIPGLPNMGMTSSQAPTPFGNLTTIPGLPNMGGMSGSEGLTPLGSQSKDPAMPGLPNMSMTCSEDPTSLGNLTQNSTMPGSPNTGLALSQVPTHLENLTTMSGLQNVGLTFNQVLTPVGNQTRDATVIALPIWGLTYSQVPTYLGNLPDNTTVIGLPIVGLIYSQNPTHLGDINRDLTTPDVPDTHPSESGMTTKL